MAWLIRKGNADSYSLHLGYQAVSDHGAKLPNYSKNSVAEDGQHYDTVSLTWNDEDQQHAVVERLTGTHGIAAWFTGTMLGTRPSAYRIEVRRKFRMELTGRKPAARRHTRGCQSGRGARASAIPHGQPRGSSRHRQRQRTHRRGRRCAVTRPYGAVSW
jgi:hypothetical protein